MAEATLLSRTPLADWHQENGGRLVDFAGWAMPVQYGSIVDEHQATRTAVGLFDVSHMGRVRVTGEDAAQWLDGLLTRRVADLKPGRIRYSLVCNELGGVLDDILAGRVADNEFSLVVNASNREKLLRWFSDRTAGSDVEMTDRTEATAMIAVQGPGAIAALQTLCEVDFDKLRYYRATTGRAEGLECEVSRTGYTGEDGCELVCESSSAVDLWNALVQAGGKPCGLASRDTLRLEAGMPLYGHELSESINPLSAGLGFAVSFEAADGSQRDFIGAQALREANQSQVSPIRVGLEVESKRPPREGYAVLCNGQPCGEVTSGTQSPTLKKPIAMALVESSATNPGAEIAVDIRGTETPAHIVPLPFYQRG